jgi:hypothetical protein
MIFPLLSNAVLPRRNIEKPKSFTQNRKEV